MRCPKCEVEMDEVRKLDVVVDSCAKCGGIWLDRGELEKIREAESSYNQPAARHEEKDHDHDHHDSNSGHGGNEGEGKKKKKKRGGFLTDIMEGFGGE